VLRYRLRYEFLARSGTGSRERRLAILAFALGFDGNVAFLGAALTDAEKKWLEDCTRAHKKNGPEFLSQHQHNLPAWVAEQLQIELGDPKEFNALAQSLLQQAPLDLRVNTFKAKRETVLADAQSVELKLAATPWSPWGVRAAARSNLAKHPLFADGTLEVQDEGSQMLALLVDAKRGEMVCDFCAGAGGKTLALGASMRNTGRLYAFDVSGHRLENLKPRLARSGLSNVHPAALSSERDERVKRLAQKMDRVLVDAPCSGMGTLRRNPDLKWRQKASDVEELKAKQLAILQSAARMVKPGGRLVYATCSLLNAENEGVAEAFMQASPDFEKLDAAELLAQLKVENAADITKDGFLRMWPHRHNTDGFFAAVWQRK
jgi:16S rRNA (cytosine967-C5)-methyltransferase